jgi:hypothetical protein
MALIVIDDLEEDFELDEQAMRAVFGGRNGPMSSLSGLSMKFAQRNSFSESALVEGLVKVNDLRQAAN